MSDEPRIATVKALPTAAANEIPRMLREMADRIESGKLLTDHVVLAVETVNGVSAYGYGRRADRARSALVLMRAGEWLSWDALPLDIPIKR